MLPVVLAALVCSTAPRAIEIDFDADVDLPFARTSPLKPLPLVARFVAGDGPALFAWASFGKIEGWHKEGNTWRGAWQPPDPAFPGELQIVVAAKVDGRAIFSALTAAVSAEIELPGRSEPDAEVEVLVGKESFGPVRAAHDGRFKVLVVVPPKTGSAVAKSKDRLGNVNKKNVDLFVPKVATLAVACPFAALEAGSAAVPAAIATALEKVGKVKLRALQGFVSALSPLGTFSYTPPEHFAEATDVVVIESALGEARCEVPLRPGPAVAVHADFDPPFVVADGTSKLKISLSARDRFDNVVAGVPLRLQEGDASVTLVDGVATLVSKAGVDERRFTITAPTFSAPLVVYQMPDREVRMVAVPGVVAVRLEPIEAAAEVTASDDGGAELALEAKGGEVRVRSDVRAKGHVLFTHLPSGTSVLVAVPK